MSGIGDNLDESDRQDHAVGYADKQKAGQSVANDIVEFRAFS